ncbi:MAG: NUDIX hydrolase [Flavobacteriales bacterium]
MKNVFKYCPNCQSEHTTFENDHLFICHDCNFNYYHNVATAVATLIKSDGKILFSVRNNEPMKGKLDLPGGFVDPGESAEQAVKRELKEELNLDVKHLEFFTTEHNTYFFKGITYRTCDVCYITEVNNPTLVIDSEEIREIKWLRPDEIKLETIGFESLRKVVKKYLDMQ